DHRDQGDIEEADEEEGQGFAQDEFGGTNGSYHDLLERADLTLADHAKRGECDDENEGETANDSRNEEPSASKVSVVPRPVIELDGRDCVSELGSGEIDPCLLIL